MPQNRPHTIRFSSRMFDCICPCPACSSVASTARLPWECVHVLLLDFNKTFDLVDHNILLSKLAKLDHPTFLLSWFGCFLCNRKQWVKLGNSVSQFFPINAGVPQGTPFGPIGFLCYISDLQPNCNITKYVDDSTLWESYAVDGHDSEL